MGCANVKTQQTLVCPLSPNTFHIVYVFKKGQITFSQTAGRCSFYQTSLKQDNAFVELFSAADLTSVYKPQCTCSSW